MAFRHGLLRLTYGWRAPAGAPSIDDGGDRTGICTGCRGMNGDEVPWKEADPIRVSAVIWARMEESPRLRGWGQARRQWTARVSVGAAMFGATMAGMLRTTTYPDGAGVSIASPCGDATVGDGALSWHRSELPWSAAAGVDEAPPWLLHGARSTDGVLLMVGQDRVFPYRSIWVVDLLPQVLKEESDGLHAPGWLGTTRDLHGPIWSPGGTLGLGYLSSCLSRLCSIYPASRTRPWSGGGGDTGLPVRRFPTRS
jgi:hypothetical protein